MELSLTRIILFGHNIEVLKNFYVDNFQLTIVEETLHQWVVLKAGAIEIALHKIGEAYTPKPGEQFKASTNTKLVFTMQTNLHSFREALLNNGVAMKEINSFQGINSLFCDGEDPEGNIFQLEERV